MYRPVSASVTLAVATVVALALLVDAVVRAGWAEALLLAPWLFLVVWVIHLSVFSSHIATDADGVRVQNLLRRTSIPWRGIEAIELHRQVQFHLVDGSRLTAVGGPVVGRPTRLARPVAGDPVENLPSQVRETAEIQDAWMRGLERADTGTSPRRGWDLVAICVLVLLLVWSGSAVLFTLGAG